MVNKKKRKCFFHATHHGEETLKEADKSSSKLSTLLGDEGDAGGFSIATGFAVFDVKTACMRP